MSLTRSLAHSRIARLSGVLVRPEGVTSGVARQWQGRKEERKGGRATERERGRGREGRVERGREKERTERRQLKERRDPRAESRKANRAVRGRRAERWGGESGWTGEEEDWRRPGNGRVGTWGGSVVRQRAVSRAGGWTGGIECGGGGGVARRWRQ